jgi:hypothetical protein
MRDKPEKRKNLAQKIKENRRAKKLQLNDLVAEKKTVTKKKKKRAI